MARQLESSFTHLNIRLFLCRLVVRLGSLLSPYASRLVDPLVRTMATVEFFSCVADGDEPSQQRPGPGIHQLLVDTLVTAMEWNVTPTEKESVKQLLDRLVESTPHRNGQIQSRNLRLIHAVCACWATVLAPTYSSK